MDIRKAAERTPKPSNPDYFTGEVSLEPLNDAPAPARVNMAKVTFQPGGRTNWHTHPFGQTLYVISGVGRVQKEGEPIREILPGDVVWIPPGENHWHGAAPNEAMCHIAVQEKDAQDMAATWLEPVSEADYTATPK